MTGSSAFSAAAQNQSMLPSVSQGSVCGVLKITRKPGHAGLLPPFRQQRGALGILQRQLAHDAEAPGIAPRRLERIVVAVARPGRRHDDDAIDAGFIHHRHQPLDGERLRQLRLEARHPFPVLGLRLPEVDLRIDDHAAVDLRGRAARALRRQRRTGPDGGAEETAS